MKLSIVIPVFNSERTIEEVCARVLSLYRERYELDIVLVNDGSDDGSDAACRRMQAANPRQMTYVRLSRNFGEHNAVIAGLLHAVGDLCVIMDDDLQNPPEEIEKLVAAMRHGYDVVYSTYLDRRDSLFRDIGSRFHNVMATLVLKKPAGLYLSSFKIINRFLIDEITKYTGPDPYIDAIILRSTANIGQITVRHQDRQHGRSGYTFGKLVSLWGNMVVSFSLYPLRLIGVLGLIMTCIGFYHGVDTIYEMMSVSDEPTEFQTLTSIIVFFRGLQLLAISIVGEYVGRIYLSVSKDPQFVVREVRAAWGRAGVREVFSHDR